MIVEARQAPEVTRAADTVFQEGCNRAKRGFSGASKNPARKMIFNISEVERSRFSDSLSRAPSARDFSLHEDCINPGNVAAGGLPTVSKGSCIYQRGCRLHRCETTQITLPEMNRTNDDR